MKINLPGATRAGTFLTRMLAAFLLVVLISPAVALEVGTTVSGYAELNGRQIPLPEGEWTAAGKGHNGVVSGVAGAFGTIDSNILLRIEAGQVRAIVELNTNSISVNEGWGTTQACAAEDMLARFNLYRTAVDGLCFFVTETKVPGAAKDSPQAWIQAFAWAKEQGLVIPQTWLTIGYRISNRHDIMDARYHLDGRELGALAPGKTEWSVEAVVANPAKFQVVSSLNAWAGLVTEFFESGLRGRLPGQLRGLSAPQPLVADERIEATLDKNAVGLASKEARKHALDKLVEEGVILSKDLDAYRAAVDAVAPPPTIEDYYKTLALKTASYNFFRVSVDYLLAYIVTANPAISGYITASIVFFHSIAQVINDVSWDNYISGQKRDGSESVEFHYIGLTPELIS